VKPGTKRRPSTAVVAAIAVAAVALAAAAWGWLRPSPAPPVSRFSLLLRPAEALRPSGNGSGNVAISPDGTRLAYVGPAEAGTRLWLRQWDRLRPNPLAGTEGGLSPFFSPDGRQLAFIVNGRSLRVLPIDGGSPITLSDSLNSSGGDWGTDGYIYVEVDSGLARIRATGGSLEPVFTISGARREIGTEWPNVLPGARGLIFRLRHQGQGAGEFDIMAMKLPHGEARPLLHGIYARYSVSGHLLVATVNGKVVVLPFDPDKLAVTGPATTLMEGVRASPGENNLALSATGTLVYASGGASSSQRPYWVNRDGTAAQVDSTWDPQGSINSVAVSPDGRMLALGLERGLSSDIWVKQLPKGPFSRITFGDSIHSRASWSADGRSVLYISDRSGGNGGVPFMTRADGTGSPRPLSPSSRNFGQVTESRDGRWILVRRVVSEPGNGDIFAIKTGDTTMVPLITTSAREIGPALSPDGRWLAYSSDESGRFEVYVRPFPDVASARWQVSLSGGSAPVWAHSGRELFFLNEKSEMVSAEIRPGAAFAVGQQRALFPAGSYTASGFYPQFDVSPDDRRFVMIRGVASAEESELIVTENWFEELKQRARK
jgi:serine/threonine-protein kinase